tara:strand:+ start:1555 stop:1998 length:444 start_codon:yes stop_codon:yes gene_type:complete
MINNKQIKLINDLYIELQFMNNITWNKYRDDIYKYELQQEKQHRNGYCNGRDYGRFTATLSAKYFTVKHMVDCINAYQKFLKDYDKSKLHTVKDYLHIKTSIIMAESFMLNYTDKSLKWYEENLAKIVNFKLLDYCELVDTEKKQVA